MNETQKDIKLGIQLTHVTVTPEGRVEVPFTEEETKEWLKNRGVITEEKSNE